MKKSKKSKKLKSKYTVVIQWSEEDQTYVVLLPEWAGLLAMPCTDGKTYRQAGKHARQVLESMIEEYQEDGKTLPQARTYAPKQPDDAAYT